MHQLHNVFSVSSLTTYIDPMRLRKVRNLRPALFQLRDQRRLGRKSKMWVSWFLSELLVTVADSTTNFEHLKLIVCENDL